jgi:hypothetical protein
MASSAGVDIIAGGSKGVEAVKFGGEGVAGDVAGDGDGGWVFVVISCMFFDYVREEFNVVVEVENDVGGATADESEVARGGNRTVQGSYVVARDAGPGQWSEEAVGVMSGGALVDDDDVGRKCFLSSKLRDRGAELIWAVEGGNNDGDVAADAAL